MQSDWNQQKVVIIGAARQGLALARFLSGRGAQVILNDQRSPETLQSAVDALAGLPVQWALGSHPVEILDGADLVCVSGGVPLELPILVEARRRGLPLTNDSQIFMQSVAAPVIGITGSAGKTTTTTLVGRMAQAHAAGQNRAGQNRAGQNRADNGVSAWVGGNIGLPLVEYLDQIQPRDPVIVEFSSFQLELMTVSPKVAAVLNITPNHLDRHGTLEAYAAAKARILAFQSPDDIAILSRDDPGSWALADSVQGRLISFGLTPPPAGQAGTYIEDHSIQFSDGQQAQALLPVEAVRLRGIHNLLNVLAACAIGLAAGFSPDSLRAGVEGFQGVAHRLEWVRDWNGAAWYNDSIATAPERVISAIQSFDEPLIVLLGGRDKNLPWDKLAQLLRERVDHVILFGESANKIRDALFARQFRVPRPGDRLQSIQKYPSLREAVQHACILADPGDVVLLSPGCTSFDQFKDFEERGECFRQWVKELTYEPS